MDYNDRTGMSRRNEEIVEAIKTVEKYMIKGILSLPPEFAVQLMTIKDGLKELLVLRANKINEYEALTIQALHMRNEIYQGVPMDKETFTDEYLNGIGKYERKIAKKEGITIGDE